MKEDLPNSTRRRLREEIEGRLGKIPAGRYRTMTHYICKCGLEKTFKHFSSQKETTQIDDEMESVSICPSCKGVLTLELVDALNWEES